ncbi:hypothetical protein CDL12_02462 [Handroanthus impetiginosus]|uniref:Myb-like domain-containing protein n=1 Tax=Handroanthus impetiginosus TaxID=429701 RepID=A0A2G9I4X4_9LAMI|nr:hypothetical protein CDL12_02462 [Handroanthus impetiginosus]
MDLRISNQSGNINEPRDYRKGNWTLQETMVLIEAKKMDEERRMKSERGKPAELRWKWVEDYCWRNGCFRSQNQCNDKWDNLMRDFKKVREYERRIMAESGGEVKSYWRIEKNERKERNLPSNMLPQIYEGLMDVMEKKGQRVVVGGGAGSGSSSANVPTTLAEKSAVVSGQYAMPTPVQQQAVPVIQSPPMLPPFAPPARAQPLTMPFSQPSPPTLSSLRLWSLVSPSGRFSSFSPLAPGEGTSGAAEGTTLQEVGSAISKSASIIAEAIQSCEEREERRHRQMLSLHERRLQIEESKAEINRQGINGLVDAINKLANSILALASNKNQTSSSK